MYERRQGCEPQGVDEGLVRVDEHQIVIRLVAQDSAGDGGGRRNDERRATVCVAEGGEHAAGGRQNLYGVGLVGEDHQAEVEHGLPVIEGACVSAQAGEDEVGIRIGSHGSETLSHRSSELYPRRMSRREQIRMTPDEQRTFWEDRRTLHVSSINSDGTPHLVPMWFTFVGDALGFWTYRSSQKIVNLQRDPRITVMGEAGDVYEELRGVTISGRAEIIEDCEQVYAFGMDVFQRYWGPVEGDLTDVRAGVEAMGSKRVLVIVHPEETVSWDHRKLGGVY